MKRYLWLIGFISLITIMSSSFSAYLEEDDKQGKTTEIIPRDRVMPPRRGNEVTSLIGRVTVGRPYSQRNITIFPLYLSSIEDDRRYVTLDEAIDKGWLKIYETGSGAVSRIDVENRSDRHIYMMAGEILGGGKQNRTISKDVLLEPRGGVVSVPVYCVEQHRWSSSGSMNFGSAKSLAPMSIRISIQSGGSQGEVWKEVDSIQKTNKIKSASGNFQEVYEDKEVKRKLAEYDSLRRLPRETIGAVIVINGRIAGAELFCNEQLFADLWHKILKSYSLDAITYKWDDREDRHHWSDLTTNDIRRYLDSVYNARFTDERAVDAGFMYDISGAISGKALIYRRAVIHLNLTGNRIIPLREDLRNERRGGDI